MSTGYIRLQIGNAPEPEFTAKQVKQAGTFVNKSWWDRTLTFDQVMERAQRAAEERQDIMVPINGIKAVNDNGEFKIQVNGSNYTPTDHALQQFSTRMKIPSSTILRELRKQDDYDNTDASVMVAVANNAIRKLQMDKVMRLRTYTDGTLRAVVTDRYAPIDNRWYLEVINEFLPDCRYSHWNSDEDTIYGNVLLPNTLMDYGQDEDSDYGGMLSLGNCEIGKRRLSQHPSIFRSICFNGNIWGQVEGKAIKRRHIGDINLDDMKRAIAENIEYQLPILPNIIRTFLETKSMKANNTSMMRVIAATVDSMPITKAQGAEIYNQWNTHESEFQSLFGVINAITRAGQLYDGATNVAFDTIAGELSIYDDNKWNRLLKKAESYDSKEIENILAIAV